MSGWTHAICGECWEERSPGREPVRVRDGEDRPCCFCGRATAEGIYVREAPTSLALVGCPGHED